MRKAWVPFILSLISPPPGKPPRDGQVLVSREAIQVLSGAPAHTLAVLWKVTKTDKAKVPWGLQPELGALGSVALKLRLEGGAQMTSRC